MHLVISQMKNKQQRNLLESREQRTIESQEAQAEEERLSEDVEPSPTTTEDIIGKAQDEEKSEFNGKQNVDDKPIPKPKIRLYPVNFL